MEAALKVLIVLFATSLLLTGAESRTLHPSSLNHASFEDESVDIGNLVSSLQLQLVPTALETLIREELKLMSQYLKQNPFDRNEFYDVLADGLIKKIGLRSRPKYG